MSAVEVDPSNQELVVNETNKGLHFGLYPNTMHGSSHDRDEKTYFQEWGNLSNDRMHVEQLRVQLRCQCFHLALWEPEKEAKILWQ
ncbi:MAG: hypothetical protein LQ343_005702 [Gyalolechia ehrenbergii]|nr:MAG: hypothetical protein LQ343_005702 [Gyalolechia ehrenbergii]